MKKLKNLITILLFGVIVVSCSDYLEITPEGQAVPENLEDFRALLTKGYNYDSQKYMTGLRTDEFNLTKSSFLGDISLDKQTYYIWEAEGQAGDDLNYRFLYQSIFNANHVIGAGGRNISNSKEKNQLLGEAYALRAYAHFDLVNLYGQPYEEGSAESAQGVPLALKVDLESNYKPSTVKEVYEAILTDLEKAEKLLYVVRQKEGWNYRFSKIAVEAFKSRVYLYMKNYEASLKASNEVLKLNNQLGDLNVADAELPFKYKSKESILALEKTTDGIESDYYISVADDFLKLFNEKDLRKSKYIRISDLGANTTAKDGAKVTFRVSEIYLNKAEALLMKGDLAKAKEAVLYLMKHRYTPDYYSEMSSKINAMNKEDFTKEMYNERARELCFEGAHRWYDLRRTTQPELKHFFDGETYVLKKNDKRYTIPFPISAKTNNPNL